MWLDNCIYNKHNTVFLVAWKKLRGGVLCCATNLTKVWGCQGWVWLIFNNAGYANFVFVQVLNDLNMYSYFFKALKKILKNCYFWTLKDARDKVSVMFWGLGMKVFAIFCIVIFSNREVPSKFGTFTFTG